MSDSLQHCDQSSGTQRVCDYEGCTKGIDTGHALYRISPKGKGEKFVGLCEENYVGEPEPVAKIIEQANHRKRLCGVQGCEDATVGDMKSEFSERWLPCCRRHLDECREVGLTVREVFDDE
jgi:hypothetical protein